MDLAGTLDTRTPLGKPWRFTGTEMRPNFLLMCKLLFALLALHSFVGNFRDPFLPFVSSLDLLRSSSAWFELALHIVFWGAGCCLLFNYRVRWAAIALGLLVVLTLLASKPLFRNHLFIVGCLFLLTGLHRKEEDPWMLRWQMVIIYIGAFLNKVLQVDWRSGQFMHHWLHHDLANPYYEAFRPHLPEPGFAIAISWTVIGSELILAVLFAVRRWANVAVTLAIAMHVTFYVLVGRKIFGHFTEDALLAMLVFLNWPKNVVSVGLGPSVARLTERVRAWFNWDRQFAFDAVPSDAGNWLELREGDVRSRNWTAAWSALKYSPAFYVGVFAMYHVAVYLIEYY